MGSNRSMSRENKKKQLRSQMVSSSVSSPEDEDSEELIKKAHQKSVKRRVRIGAVIGVLIWPLWADLYIMTDICHLQTMSLSGRRILIRESRAKLLPGKGIFPDLQILRRCDQVYQGWSFLSGFQGKGRMDFKL